MKDATGTGIGLLKALLVASLILLASVSQTTAAAVTSPTVTVPLLRVGSDYFTNATLTPQSAKHVTVMHSRGMTMAKMADLDPEVQQQLGFDPSPTKGSKATASSQASTNATFLGKLKKMGDEFQAGADQAQADREAKGPPLLRALQKMGEDAEQHAKDSKAADRFENATWLEKSIGFSILGAIIVLYFLFCNACRHLCRRAGAPSEILIWIPGWKRLALYRATGTSWWWFFLVIMPFFGPLIAGIGWILCCVRLCDAFQQSRWWVWLMLIPVIGWIVFIHFAKASEGEDKEPAIRSMNSGYAF
jgi:hypothetical protein